MTTDETKARFLKLGPDALAGALLDLAERDDTAKEMIERMVSTPEDRVRRFKSRLAGLKRGRKFNDWKTIGELVQKLKSILAELDELEIDPCLMNTIT